MNKKPHIPDRPEGEQDDNNPRYEVGYRRPPREYQFPKGISGNPGGRPKAKPLASNVSPANDAAIREAARKIKVREGSREVEMTAQEAVLRAAFASSIKGNAAAQREYLRFTRRALDEASKVRDRQFLTIYRYKLALIEEREALRPSQRKRPPGTIDPDWIRFDRELNPHVIEPVSTSDRRFWERLQARLSDEMEELVWLRREARRDPANTAFWAGQMKKISSQIRYLRSLVPEGATYELLDI